MTHDFADNFNSGSGFDFGTDGPGSVAYKLELTGSNVASGMFAVDPSLPNGKGAEILLDKVGSDIVGTSISHVMPLHLRRSASYQLRACNVAGCSASAAGF